MFMLNTIFNKCLCCNDKMSAGTGFFIRVPEKHKIELKFFHKITFVGSFFLSCVSNVSHSCMAIILTPFFIHYEHEMDVHWKTLRVVLKCMNWVV